MRIKYYLFILLFSCISNCPTVVEAASPATHVESAHEAYTPSRKEVRKYQKQHKRIIKVQHWLNKHKDKVSRFEKQTGTSDDYLRWALLSVAAAVGLAVLSIFAGFLWFFAALAAIAAAVFFILWLLEYA